MLRYLVTVLLKIIYYEPSLNSFSDKLVLLILTKDEGLTRLYCSFLICVFSIFIHSLLLVCLQFFIYVAFDHLPLCQKIFSLFLKLFYLMSHLPLDSFHLACQGVEILIEYLPQIVIHLHIEFSSTFDIFHGGYGISFPEKKEK